LKLVFNLDVFKESGVNTWFEKVLAEGGAASLRGPLERMGGGVADKVCGWFNSVASIITGKACSTCGKGKDSTPGGQPLRRCRCGKVLYCSAECQRKDWSKHKAVCTGLQKPSEEAPPKEVEEASSGSMREDDTLLYLGGKAAKGDPMALAEKASIYWRMGDVISCARIAKPLAESGYFNGEALMGIIYLHAKDDDRAETWFLKAAEQGSVNSMGYLSALYRRRAETIKAAGGDGGEDEERARTWGGKAKKRDPSVNEEAEDMLGNMDGASEEAAKKAVRFLETGEVEDANGV
jgi:hypothetical protein